ncbi:MAG TPA: AAA family ATPase [Patescibacteria group bacterium]|nr:AAA family ATPase [Patescibacteria group bacterium]
MNIDNIEGYSLKNLSKINVVLGKNGCGKSTLLKKVENGLSSVTWGKKKYITPERGGSLVYDAGVDGNTNTNLNWLSESRRTNQFNQFRQQSVAQFKKLELLVLREIDERRRADTNYKFSIFVDKINTLLDNVEIRKEDVAFRIYKKGTDTPVEAGAISSGESELISLGIECLIFSKEVVSEKENILFLDEPDVHLHPDLQSRLVAFLKVLVEESDFTVVIATHSTAILGELSTYPMSGIALMKSGDVELVFSPISEVFRKVLPVFGAHPLSNIFNQAPVLLLEGEDDERIWQSVVRSSSGRIKIFPVFCDSVDQMNNYELETKKIIDAVYDKAKAYSLRDKDDNPESINDILPVTRMRLSCRNAENLILTNEVISKVSMNWNTVKQKIDLWLAINQTHPKYAEMQSFKDGGYDRKNFDLKGLRMLIVGTIFNSNKPWEVLVGQTIGEVIYPDTIDYSEDGSLFAYLGEKTTKNLIIS